MSHILIVDDEVSICWAFRESLTDEGHEVSVAASAEEALSLVEQRAPDAVVLDVRLPGMDGLSAIGQFRRRIGSTPIIVITAFGNLETAVRAIEGGAFDYLTKPFDLEQATAVIHRALDAGSFQTQPGGEKPEADLTQSIIGCSPAMHEIFKQIALVATTDVPVLITGESGTGKELVARAIHRHSPRRGGPYVPTCLPALSPGLVESELFGHVQGAFTGAIQDRKGLLELAHGGTLFLDEIADTTPALQVKLLRAIEQREVTPVGDAHPRATDIRVLAATNRPLAERLASGQFREDLFFRLSVFQIHLPPLRERTEDIPVLAEHFLQQCYGPRGCDFHLSDELRRELCARPWPGNVRELRNAVQYAAILARGGRISLNHLPVSTATPLKQQLAVGQELQSRVTAWVMQEMKESSPTSMDYELHERLLQLVEPPLLQATLQGCGHNRAATAKILGLHRATLRQKLQRYRIT